MSYELLLAENSVLKRVCLQAMGLAPTEAREMLRAFGEYTGTEKEDSAVTMFNAFIVKLQLGVPIPFAELWNNCKTRQFLWTALIPAAIS